jgi:hypothetical protein
MRGRDPCGRPGRERTRYPLCSQTCKTFAILVACMLSFSRRHLLGFEPPTNGGDMTETEVRLSMASATVSSPLPPLVPGLPLVGNAPALANDSIGFVVAQYKRLGLIFRVRPLDEIGGAS